MLCVDASPVGETTRCRSVYTAIKAAEKVTHDTNRVCMTADVSLPVCTAADEWNVTAPTILADASRQPLCAVFLSRRFYLYGFVRNFLLPYLEGKRIGRFQ